MQLAVSLAEGFSSSLEVGAGQTSWRIGAQTVARGTTTQVLAACAQSIGKPLRDWPLVFQGQGLVLAPMDGYGTAQSNAVKAVALFALWLEPMVLAGGQGIDAATLSDEVIVDYTGALGQQPYLYVLPDRLQRDDNAQIRLFELKLLSRLTIAVGNDALRWWFKPLVTAIVRVDQLGPAERLWSGIKNEMQAAVRRAAGGRR